LKKIFLKKKKLLDEWGTFEKQVISMHEKSEDLSSAGNACNEVLEYSRSHRYWLTSNHSEAEKNKKE